VVDSGEVVEVSLLSLDTVDSVEVVLSSMILHPERKIEIHNTRITKQFLLILHPSKSKLSVDYFIITKVLAILFTLVADSF